jgi:AcrR family transcriptional regulator
MSRQATNLSRETIAAAALEIADQEGFDAVSMRRVAQELNVGTMSLYYYVKTKDDLIAVMDDALLGEALLPSLPKDWQQAMMEIARHTHALFLRHPWALVSMLSAPPGLNAMRHMEQCLEALAETHMTNSEKLAFLATIDDFVFGHALREAANDTEIDIEFAAAQLATGAFPRIAKIFAKGRIETTKDRFDQGLQALFNGLPYTAVIAESSGKKSKKKKKGRH